MSTSLRDRARTAASKTPKKAEKPASVSKDAEVRPKPATVTTTVPTPVDADATKSADTEGETNVVSLASKAIAKLDPSKVSEILEAHADEVADLGEPEAEPFTATLAATRQTKANQIQYDGKTPEGYVVRVWAPEGSEMIVGVTLARAGDIPG